TQSSHRVSTSGGRVISFKSIALLLIASAGLLLLREEPAFRVVTPTVALGLLSAFLLAFFNAIIRCSRALWRRGYRRSAWFLIAMTVGSAIYPSLSAFALTSDKEIDQALVTQRPSEDHVSFFARDGDSLVRVFAESERRVSKEEVAESWIKLAIIAIEDRRLTSRLEGVVDFIAAPRALWKTAVEGKRQGGSDIPIQNAKLLSGKFRSNLSDKPKQVLVAIRLDQRFPTTDEMLCLYVNLVQLGNKVGLASSAADLFGTSDLRNLTIAQSALLAGMIQRPSHYDPRANPRDARERRDFVLQRMHEQGMISDQQHREAFAELIQVLPALKDFEVLVRAAKAFHAIEGVQ
ncbi:MAG: transglycosylase domain-containing protein, partial [Terriglobia bacterium]